MRPLRDQSELPKAIHALNPRMVRYAVTIIDSAVNCVVFLVSHKHGLPAPSSPRNACNFKIVFI
jgi:hypothetical protein